MKLIVHFDANVTWEIAWTHVLTQKLPAR